MRLTYKSILKTYVKTLKESPKNYLLLIIPILADMLFFVFYFMLKRFHEIKFQTIIFELENSLSMQVRGLVDNFVGTVGIFDLFDMFPIIKTTVFKLILFNTLLTLTIALSYIIFQSVSWKTCYNLSNRKIKYTTFFKRFTLNVLFWTAIIILFNVLYFAFKFITIMVFKSTGFLIMIAWWLIVLCIVYYGLICHGEFHKKFSISRCIKIGNKNFKHLAPVIIIMIATIFMINLIVSLTPYSNLQLLFEVIFVLPSLSLMRIFFLNISSSKKRSDATE